MEHLIDEKGKWKQEGLFKILVDPSIEYLQILEQEKLNSLLTPIFEEPNILDSEVQLAKFILDITEILEEFRGGNV